MHKRNLKDLNLLDDFLLNAVVTYPGIGETFCRILLGIIFQRKFGKLVIVAQKVYYGTDVDKHGARLDVYLEEDEIEIGEGDVPTVLDIEPEKKDSREAVKSLPKRTRFYHAKIDGRSLKSGESYKNLKNVIVIMITPFDPFGLNRMVYTIRNLCEEVPDMPYDDGARTLFLYTKGIEGNPSEELQQLLNYMETTTQENAKNEELRTIQKMVETVKQSEEVSISYMKIMEREEMLINEGISQGISQGKSIGEMQKLIQQVCRKLRKGKSAPIIAEELEEAIEVVERICAAIVKCGSDTDIELIYNTLEEATAE